MTGAIVTTEQRMLAAAETDRETFAAFLTPGAILVGEAGCLDGEALWRAIRAIRPRARAMTEIHTLNAAPHAVVLSYRLDPTAQPEPSRAPIYCSSVWLERPDGWRLICHQQSAVHQGALE